VPTTRQPTTWTMIITSVQRGALLAAVTPITLGAATAGAAQTLPCIFATRVGVGEAKDHPAKDMAEFVGTNHGSCPLGPRFSAARVWVGQVGGEPERDTFGLVVVAHHECATDAAGAGSRSGK
jgi:hypothetical protein